MWEEKNLARQRKHHMQSFVHNFPKTKRRLVWHGDNNPRERHTKRIQRNTTSISYRAYSPRLVQVVTLLRSRWKDMKGFCEEEWYHSTYILIWSLPCFILSQDRVAEEGSQVRRLWKQLRWKKMMPGPWPRVVIFEVKVELKEFANESEY